jgi:hypothetical protein
MDPNFSTDFNEEEGCFMSRREDVFDDGIGCAWIEGIDYLTTSPLSFLSSPFASPQMEGVP